MTVITAVYSFTVYSSADRSKWILGVHRFILASDTHPDDQVN